MFIVVLSLFPLLNPFNCSDVNSRLYVTLWTILLSLFFCIGIKRFPSHEDSFYYDKQTAIPIFSTEKEDQFLKLAHNAYEVVTTSFS